MAPFTERMQSFSEDLKNLMQEWGVALKEHPIIKPDGTIGAEIKVYDLQSKEKTDVTE